MRKGRLLRLILTVLILVQCISVVIFENTYFINNRKEKEEIKLQETIEEAGDEPGELYAQSAVLMDADSGRILFGKNEREVRPMASTTKIMTCIITLEQMQKNQIASVSDLASGQPKVHLGVQTDEKYYISDLLYSLMLESHNDSAVVIAEAIGGTVEGFAELMNDKAEEIGCEDTHFVTPNGLDGEDEKGLHATTAADLALIMRYCICESPKKEEFLEITGTKSYSFTDVEKKRSFSCNNHNTFLDMMDGALSGKTGFTAEAGYCYVGALRQEKRTFIVALLACGWPGNKSYKWKDTKKLMEFALSHYRYRNVYEKMPDTVIPVKGGADALDSYRLDCQVAVGVKQEEEEKEELMVLLRDDEKVTIEKKIKTYMNAPVKKWEKAGQYIYLLNGNEIRRYDIVTLEAVEKRDLDWCMKKVLERVCL
ncbi:MAG: serine hydrolase [Lachnospiraceae bacterium]